LLFPSPAYVQCSKSDYIGQPTDQPHVDLWDKFADRGAAAANENMPG